MNGKRRCNRKPARDDSGGSSCSRSKVKPTCWVTSSGISVFVIGEANTSPFLFLGKFLNDLLTFGFYTKIMFDLSKEITMSDEKNDWLKRLAKGIVITLVVLLAIAIVGFGLLVGFCYLGSRR